MKKGIWVALAVAIAVAGAWGYGALVRQENDDGRRVQLLAIAEEQRLDLSFSRSGRLVTRVPEEGEAVAKGSLVARIEEPGLSQDASDLERQRDQLAAQERSRVSQVGQLQAPLAHAAS